MVCIEIEWVEIVENGWNVFDFDVEYLSEYVMCLYFESDLGYFYGDGKVVCNVVIVLLKVGE